MRKTLSILILATVLLISSSVIAADKVIVIPLNTCSDGLTMCSGQCVDTINNPNYCGDCDTSCPEGYLCVSGTCANVCDDGDDICTNDIFDLVEGCTHTMLPQCQSCNPVAQTGCPPDHKCSFTAGNGTSCIPDGSKPNGETCEVTIEGVDDCVAGNFCYSGFCQEICTNSPNSCGTGWICLENAEYFTDLTNVGLCAPLCDPVLQDCRDTSEACYLVAINALTYCYTIPVEAVGHVQGDPCYGPEEGNCLLNGCDKGYGADMLWMDPDTCSFFCNPIDNWLLNTNGLAGDPAGITCNSTFGGLRPDGPGAGYECVYIQSLFSNTDLVAASTGTCRPVPPYGSCADFDWVGLQADIASGVANQTGYCDTHPERCRAECISNATFETAFPTQSLYLPISNLTSKPIELNP